MVGNVPDAMFDDHISIVRVRPAPHFKVGGNVAVQSADQAYVRRLALFTTGTDRWKVDFFSPFHRSVTGHSYGVALYYALRQAAGYMHPKLAVWTGQVNPSSGRVEPIGMLADKRQLCEKEGVPLNYPLGDTLPGYNARLSTN
jgi:hypothetical protein